jgi:CubicO group peptidase (beta-lactamase class C family)
VTAVVTPPAALAAAQRYAHQALADGWFPGAQVLVAAGEQVVWHEAMGHAALEPEAARMEAATFIDVASLTKALVTATCAARLVSTGRLQLDDVLGAFLPAPHEKTGLSVRRLLSHAAGFPIYVPYFRELVGRFAEFRDLPYAALRSEIVGRVLAEPLVAAPGATQQYSDLDFMLLGEVVARAARQDLDAFFAAEIAGPLGLGAHFRRLPAEPVRGSRYAATEHCPWRGEVLQGAVHDDHAYLMGGVAGHAGLFATAADVFALTRAWVRAYQGREGGPLSPAAARTFLARQSPNPTLTWALGWDTPTPGESTSGSHFSPRSVGHLGFTGASMWIDLDRDLTVILLTNRIHPLRSNLGIKPFRPVFHDRVMEGLLAHASH